MDIWSFRRETPASQKLFIGCSEKKSVPLPLEVPGARPGDGWNGPNGNRPLVEAVVLLEPSMEAGIAHESFAKGYWTCGYACKGKYFKVKLPIGSTSRPSPRSEDMARMYWPNGKRKSKRE